MLFNIRVYGILQNAAGDYLVSDEMIKGDLYTKFCGGGLEYGEGTRQCLMREFQEELGIDVIVGEHIYTTDFFVESKFAKEQQVVSIYYQVMTEAAVDIPVQREPVAEDLFFVDNEAGTERFRFVPADSLTEAMFSLPIDKEVAKLLMSK